MSSRCFAAWNRKVEVCCGCFPARFVIAIMTFFGCFHVYLLRVNLSVAIVAMVDYNSTETLAINLTLPNLVDDASAANSSGSVEPLASWASCGNNSHHGDHKTTDPEAYSLSKKFLWNANMQGLALGCYFYGYICSQVIGAWLGRKVGLTRLWGGCMTMVAILTLLLPASLEIGFGCFILARILIGLFSGISYPIMHAIMSMWAPPKERGKLLVLQFSGASVSSAIAFPLGGYLSQQHGWQSWFYVTGTSGLVWAVLLLVIVRDSPSQHPRIAESEKEYIESALEQNTSSNNAAKQLQMPVPWKSLLLSYRMWSTVVPHFATNFGTYIFLTLLPTYLTTMLNMDLESSGAWSSAPYISKLCLFPVAGILADFAIAKGIRTVYIRKIWTGIANFIPAIALIAATYTGCNIPLLIFLFSLPDATDTFSIPGFKAAMIEMAPPFAGIIFGIANTFANASGFLAPQIAGAFREAYKDDPIYSWTILFWLGAIMYIFGGATFVLFGTSDLQSWARPSEQSKNELHILEETPHEPANQKKNG